MPLDAFSATKSWPKTAKGFDFPKHGHIRDSQYPFESGAVGAFSCFTNTSLLFPEKLKRTPRGTQTKNGNIRVFKPLKIH